MDDQGPHDGAPPASSAGSYRLGDLEVRRMGFGAMRLSQDGPAFAPGSTPSDRARAIEVLRRAVALGVNHVDTAAFYFSSRRSANELINSALAPYPEDLVIVTKVGPGRDESGEWRAYARPDQLRGQVEENLRQLGLEHLDVVNLRWSAGVGALPDLLGALVELRDAGLVRHLGISGVTVDELDEARSVTEIVCVQNKFGLTTDRSTEVLQACGEHGIAFVPYFSIAGEGRHRGPVGPVADALATVAAEHGASTAQVLLAWSLAQGANVLVIPGTCNPAHLEENVRAAQLRLTEVDLQRLA